jgi:hypothetical protein
MGLVSLSAASSCTRSSFFCGSGMDLLALIEAILIRWLGELLGLLVDAGNDCIEYDRDGCGRLCRYHQPMHGKLGTPMQV